jgi:hypothetical protein
MSFLQFRRVDPTIPHLVHQVRRRCRTSLIPAGHPASAGVVVAGIVIGLREYDLEVCVPIDGALQ